MIRLTLLTILSVGLFNVAQAQDWGTMATVSSTMGINANRICMGEGTRGDIGCPTYAPSISPTGTLTVDNVSLTSAGITWGYLANSLSYLPTLSTGSISTTSISVSTINGVSATLFGGTQVSFAVHRNNVNQTVSDNVMTAIDWTTKVFDTNNNFNLTTDRFTPTIPGKYFVSFSAYCTPSTGYCTSNIYKNGGQIVGGHGYGANEIATISAIIDMNGSTDYLTAHANANGGTTINGSSAYTFFQGALINAAGGTGGSGMPTGAISAFNLAACPSGWSEYTPARGRFLRGIDSTGTNDSVRTAGNTQEDAFQGHKHQFSRNMVAVAGVDSYYDYSSSTASSLDANYYDGASIMNAAPVTDGTNGTPRTATETRPKNVAVLFCQKD